MITDEKWQTPADNVYIAMLYKVIKCLDPDPDQDHQESVSAFSRNFMKILFHKF